MKKRTNFFTLILICLCFLHCKKADSQTFNKNVNHLENAQNLKITDCHGIVKKIIESSGLKLEIYKGNYNIKIENIQSDSINIHVYTENNLSDDPNDKQIVESTIAWLLFLPNKQKLLNITADPDNPIELKYDKNILKNNNVFQLCGITRNDEKKIANNKAEVSCRKISGEMMSGEECTFKHSQIEKIYNNIITEKLVDDSNYLIKNLPETNQIIEINKNGLISIEYKINNNKIYVQMLYEGGSTEIFIEQKDESDIVRKIIYNAD